jgi:hypothetical protein
MKSDIRSIGNSYSEPLIDLILTIQQKEFNIPVGIEDQPDLIEIENFYQASGEISGEHLLMENWWDLLL